MTRLLLPFLGSILIACAEAETLGDKPPDEVTITGTPTWRNGVSELVQMKCASCHQAPLGQLAPAYTPEDMDLRYFASQPGVRGAETLGIWIEAGILRKALGGIRRMPLDHATPLTEAEMEALEQWAALGTPLE